MSRKSKTHVRRPAAAAGLPPGDTSESGGSKNGKDPRPAFYLRQKIFTLGVCLLLAVVTWVVLGQTLRHEFVNFDDSLYVTENGHVLAGLSWGGLRWAFKNLAAGFWHPLTWISLMGDAQVYGLRAWGYHLTNLLLHVASTVGLFLVLQRTTGASGRSAVVAALFAWHPLHVESVAWVAERKDVLSTFFFMLTLWAYACYAQNSEFRALDSRPPPSALFYRLALVCFICGLMSKAMVVTLPVVLLLMDYWPLGRLKISRRHFQFATLRRLVWEKAPFLAVGFVFGLLTVFAEKSVGALAGGAHLAFKDRAANAILSCVRYLWQTVCPINLAVYYPYPESFSPGLAMGALVLIVFITLAGLGWGARYPYLAVGWLWYVITLSPMSGLIPVGAHASADRYTYVPLIGVFVMVVWGAGALFARWRVPGLVTGVVAGLILVACGVRTRDQLRNWRDSESLWRHALSCTSGNSVAHKSLGDALVEKGRMEEAIAHWQTAIAINPNHAKAHNNLGVVFFRTRRTDAAIAHFKQAIAINPADVEAHNNLGLAYFEKGQMDEAIAHWQKAVAINPDYANAHNNLGFALLAAGRVDAAIGHYQRAIEINPNDAEVHHNLGLAFFKTGRLEQAMVHLQQAVEINPQLIAARNNLARMLATCPVASLRNGVRAVALAEQSDQLAGGKNPELRGTLAAAYAEAGRFSNAVAAARQALQLARDQNNPALADKLRQELGLYESGLPCRDNHPTVLPALPSR